jgi:hypothetical protein
VLYPGPAQLSARRRNRQPLPDDFAGTEWTPHSSPGVGGIRWLAVFIGLTVGSTLSSLAIGYDLCIGHAKICVAVGLGIPAGIRLRAGIHGAADAALTTGAAFTAGSSSASCPSIEPRARIDFWRKTDIHQKALVLYFLADGSVLPS